MKKSMVTIAMLSAALMTGATVVMPAANINTVSASSVVVTPKADLSKTLTEAQAIKSNDVSDATYTGLQRAIGLAKATLANKASDTVDFNFAKSVLRGFMDLGSTKANHFGLTYLVSSAASVKASDYTASSYAKFNKVYMTAQAVNNNTASTQAQLDAQTNNLNQALEQLVYTAPTPVVGKVTVHYVKGYGIQIWSSYKASKKVVKDSKGKAKKLMHGSSWKVFASVNYNGHTWYNLGGNQWIDSSYVVYHK
jgi:hypothetical protein